MIKPAFSTVACPGWTLDRVARKAAEWGYSGVELRSFGAGGTVFACDPGLTDGAKVRRMFHEQGVEAPIVATGVRFDAPVFPPVMGYLSPSYEDSVREGKHAIDIAHDIGARFVRVYAFETAGREPRRAAMRRICDRLARTCDHARHRDVTVVLQNGGSFPKAQDVMNIVRRVGSPLLGVAYDIATAHQAGEDPVKAASTLGDLMKVVHVRDLRDTTPCRLGNGDVPVERFVRTLRALTDDVWVTFVWDKAWLPEIAEAEQVLPGGATQLYEWGVAAEPQPRAFAAA